MTMPFFQSIRKSHTINLVFFLIYSQISFGGTTSALKELLTMKNRPSITDVETALHKDLGPNWLAESQQEEKNSFGRYDKLNNLQGLAYLIASVEYAAPGAKIAPMGRDAALIADVLESFYRSIGQPDRVIKIDISGPTFREHRFSQSEFDRILVKYLQQIGLPKPEDILTSQGFYPLDVTSWRSTSQSTSLVRAVFKIYTQAGINPKELLNKFNFIGIPLGGVTVGDDIKSHYDISEYRRLQSETVNNEGPEYPIYLPSRTLDFAYTAAWHPMFNKLIDEGDVVVPEFPIESGWGSSQTERKRVLEEMIMVLKITPSLLNIVKTVAENDFDYKFPMERSHILDYVQTEKRNSVKPSIREAWRPNSYGLFGYQSPKAKNETAEKKSDTALSTPNLTEKTAQVPQQSIQSPPSELPPPTIPSLFDVFARRYEQGESFKNVSHAFLEDLAEMTKRGSVNSAFVRKEIEGFKAVTGMGFVKKLRFSKWIKSEYPELEKQLKPNCRKSLKGTY